MDWIGALIVVVGDCVHVSTCGPIIQPGPVDPSRMAMPSLRALRVKFTAFVHLSKDEHEAFARALKEYRYQAPALSLLEKMGLDNFWNLLARRVYPRWLAPNLLTAAGGACIALAAGLTLWHSPSLDGSCPQWVYALNAALFFGYQSLDGSDGKQARATSSGSPVGELMDHGIDAWAVGALVTTCLDAFGFGLSSPWPWMILLGAQGGFYASNLTLLHTGRMRVDDMGVIELQTTMMGCLLLSAACTPAVWRIPVPWIGLERRVALGAATMLAMGGAIVTGVGEALSAGPAAGAGANVMGANGGVPEGATSPSRGSVLRQAGLVAGYVALVAGALARLGVGAPHTVSATSMWQLRMLLVVANSAFAEVCARLLVMRIGGRPLPNLATPALGALAGFVAAVELVGGVAAPAAAALTVAALHAGYFIWAVRTGSAALGLHTFRVRGAHSWRRL